KDVKIDLKVLEFGKIISRCNSNSNLLNELILDKDLINQIITKNKKFAKRDKFDKIMKDITFEWKNRDISLVKDLLDIIENDNEFILFLEEYRNNILLSFLNNIRSISERTKLTEKYTLNNELVNRIHNCFNFENIFFRI
ncbi:14297_t:CDS:2, partial [Cetraspora pellucida]